VQEALTNAIKHAGAARARVNVSVGVRCLELEVSDDGHAPPRRREGDRERGHGLVGMSERVTLYGGELRAGRRADADGFEVRARIPLDAAVPAVHIVTMSTEANRPTVATGCGVRWPWLDSVFAGVLVVVFEIGVLTGSHRHGALVVNMLAVAAIALAAIWRRRSPLWFLILVGVLAAVMNAYLTRFDHAPVLAAYFLLVPAYTAAAWQGRRTAALALAFLLVSTAISVLIAHHQPAGNLAGAALTISASWGAGLAIRARRSLAAELQRAAARLTLEREDRAQLAVAGERSRIASELHAIVARSVAGMVVQAEGARSMLERDPVRADAAMDAIEDVGRQTLAEMRRILGALRHAVGGGELEPQPGVAQVYALIQRARARGQPVELSVEGEPGTLPAGVDLGLYRILEDALEGARRQPPLTVGVALRFREEDLELQLTARCEGPNEWPTDAMRERVALCDGALDDEGRDEDGWRFVARMPRGMQGALP
jgi:signal transduction histidine kinase